MLPVQVKGASSSRCSLSEASVLLQRFLSSDACSDSIAREYVANVAQALEDSESGLCGDLESPGHPAPSLSHRSKLNINAKERVPSRHEHAHTNEKQKLPSGEDADASLEVESVLPGQEHGFEKRKKRRENFAVENGFETGVRRPSDIDYSALVHCDKKGRKREEHKPEIESVVKELFGSDDKSFHDTEGRKERQLLDTRIVERDHIALHNLRCDGKKRRKKEKQGKDIEDVETLSILENMGSPLSLSLPKRKVEGSYMNTNNSKVSVMPMSRTPDEFAGSLNGKQKEGKMFPLATQSVEKEREETGREVSPVVFQNLVSVAEKAKKKKRERNR